MQNNYTKYLVARMGFCSGNVSLLCSTRKTANIEPTACQETSYRAFRAIKLLSVALALAFAAIRVATAAGIPVIAYDYTVPAGQCLTGCSGCAADYDTVVWDQVQVTVSSDFVPGTYYVQ
jgi:hypothetical protein